MEQDTALDSWLPSIHVTMFEIGYMLLCVLEIGYILLCVLEIGYMLLCVLEIGYMVGVPSVLCIVGYMKISQLSMKSLLCPPFSFKS